jgi:hypothetical protein
MTVGHDNSALATIERKIGMLPMRRLEPTVA